MMLQTFASNIKKLHQIFQLISFNVLTPIENNSRVSGVDDAGEEAEEFPDTRQPVGRRWICLFLVRLEELHSPGVGEVLLLH